MKRSKNVYLTLLVPAMAAFGCSRETAPAGSGGSFDTATAEPAAANGEVVEKTDEEKNANGTAPHSTVSHASTPRHHSSYFYLPWLMGHRSGATRTMPTPVGTGVNRSSGISHPNTTSHPSGASHPGPTHSGSVHPSGSISHGGFGGTGSHLSGGS
jgi:hypothetical protein